MTLNQEHFLVIKVYFHENIRKPQAQKNRFTGLCKLKLICQK